MILNFKHLLIVFISFTGLNAFSANKYYELKVQRVTKNFTGVDVHHALAINGSIPAPTLRFKLGDQAIIKVINETNEPTTMHWHGLLVPWQQDGPQFSNTRIIAPGKSHTFKFPIRHTGTYWYHSHTEFQEQRGLYGPIVIEDAKKRFSVDHDFVFIMSDWINEHPQQVLKNLKKDGDWYAFKKKFVPSLLGAIKHGAVWDYLKGQWTRMGPMDLSDVGYDAFLVNGMIKSKLENVTHGQKIRFRIINASASSFFYFNIGNYRNFTVVAKDGVDVRPVTVNEISVGIAETYDIIFDVPHKMKIFEARATAQDITGFASLMFGSGEEELVPHKMRPSPYGMDHDHGDHGDHDDHDDGEPDDDDDGPGDSGPDDNDGPSDNEPGDHDHDHMGHGKHQTLMRDNLLQSMEDDLLIAEIMGDGHDDDHDHPMPTPTPHPMPKTKRLEYKMLKSLTPTKFDDNLIRAQVIELELSGDMERYTWYINGRPFSEDKYIHIKENEIITFKFINKTMMHHPMHLHGHFFRVLMGQGDFAPLFHTVDVAPMKDVTIEFHANEPGIWFLHCHNLYHMKMGMSRLIKYEGIELTQDLIDDAEEWGSQMTHDNDSFWRGNANIYSNTANINLGINAGRYEVEMELEVDENDIDTLEGEILFKRYLNRFLAVGGGAVMEDQKIYAALTAAYQLPGLIELEGLIRHDGKAIIRLSKSIPITSKIFLDLTPELSFKKDFEWSFDSELYYTINNNLSVGVNYRRDEEGEQFVGVGIKVRF